MQKKRLKHRFWSELYQGAKLFYLSGVVNGRYPDREVLNLSRFLSVMKKPRPLIFRQSHPYCLADRMLDLTPPAQIEEDAKCDRTVALYGYLRGGTNFSAEGQSVHIPGIGDLKVVDIEPLPDQVPALVTSLNGPRALAHSSSRGRSPVLTTSQTCPPRFTAASLRHALPSLSKLSMVLRRKTVANHLRTRNTSNRLCLQTARLSACPRDRSCRQCQTTSPSRKYGALVWKQRGLSTDPSMGYRSWRRKRSSPSEEDL